MPPRKKEQAKVVASWVGLLLLAFGSGSVGSVTFRGEVTKEDLEAAVKASGEHYEKLVDKLDELGKQMAPVTPRLDALDGRMAVAEAEMARRTEYVALLSGLVEKTNSTAQAVIEIKQNQREMGQKIDDLREAVSRMRVNERP